MPSRCRPSTRAIVSASPASTARRRSGPYGLLTDRTKAQLGTAPASGDRSTIGQLGGVVVLDHQDVRMCRQHVAQRGRPGRGHRRTGRIVRPGRDHHGPGPGRQSTAQAGDRRPLVVDRHRYRDQAERGDQIERRGPARILDRDPVTGAQMRAEHPLDPVQRTTGDADCGAGRSTPSRLNASAASVRQRTIGRPSRRQRRQQRGSGPPDDRSRASGGTANRHKLRAPATAGRDRIRVPLRPEVTTMPRWRSAW